MTSAKIGIVCSGGGMRCAYSAGALAALQYHYKFKTPHVVVGASGSAGNCAYYVAGQVTLGKKIWCEHLTNNKMISRKKWPIVNIDYLVNKVFKEYVPLDLKALENSSVTFLAPVTNTRNGFIEYISNKQSDVDLLQLLVAAKTIPFVSGLKQRVKQNNEDTYVDGDIAQQLTGHVDAARRNGADIVIVIDNQKQFSSLLGVMYTLQSIIAPKSIRSATKRGLADKRELLNSNKITTVLRPSQPLHMSGLTDKKEAVESAYDLGYRDACNDPALRLLLTS